MLNSNWKSTLKNSNKINLSKKNDKIFSRNIIITSDYIDQTVLVYNGIRFFEINILKSMVGHKFGEFSPSRIKPTHKKKKNK